MSVLEYKCPNCGGTLKFDAATQKMSCEYCDSSFEMEVLKKYEDAVLNSNEEAVNPDLGKYEQTNWTGEEMEGLKAYLCPACGGEIIGDLTVGATKCPYCDSATVMPGQFDAELRPDYILPFKKTKEEAIAAFKANVKGKKLVPDVFLDELRMATIKGIYVPYWLYDNDINAEYTFRGTKVQSWSDSNYRYTETSTYLLERTGDVKFVKVPVDSSTKMDDTLMESIEPFNYDALEPFSTTYLSGYLADKYDVAVEECSKRATERVGNTIDAMFKGTCSGYNLVNSTKKNVNVTGSSIKYALMPVWLLNTNYEGKIYTFAMNGQTGKFVGELPICKKKKKKMLFGWMIPAIAIIFAIAYFIG